MPARFHEQLPQVRVADLGDAAPRDALAAGVLGEDEAEPARERARRVEAREHAGLGDERERRHRPGPLHAAEGLHPIAPAGRCAYCAILFSIAFFCASMCRTWDT